MSTSSAPTDTRRVPGWERVLNAFMAAQDRTLTNVELGQIRGVQAWHQRMSDMLRYGYALTPAVQLKRGHYAYTVVGLAPAPPAWPFTHDRPYTGVLTMFGQHAEEALVQAMQIAVERIVENAETLLSRTAAPTAAPIASAPRPRAVDDAVAMLQESLGDHVADWTAADRGDLLALVRKTCSRVEDLREVAAVLDRRHADASTLLAQALIRAGRLREPVVPWPDVVELAEAAAEYIAQATPAAAAPAPQGPAPTVLQMMEQALRAAGVPMHVAAIRRRTGIPASEAKIRNVLQRIADRDDGVFIVVEPQVFALREWPEDQRALAPIR